MTMKRKPQSDSAEIEHGEGSGMAGWGEETEECTSFSLCSVYGNTSILGCKHILWIVKKKTINKIIDYIVCSFSATQS